MEKHQEPTLINIDEAHKIKLDQIRERYKDDPDHYINRLEAKHIYMFAILLAMKGNHAPKKSLKRAWLFRTAYLQEDKITLQSIIFSYKKDIKIFFPENYDEFYEVAEELANAGMGEALEILENSQEVEKSILLEINVFKNKQH